MSHTLSHPSYSRIKPIEQLCQELLTDPFCTLTGYQFEYAFDNIGNRTSAKTGGDANGTGLRESTYTSNSLNQIDSRTVPGTFDVVGSASTTSTVTVNGQRAQRTGSLWKAELEVDNDPSPVFAEVDLTAVQNDVGGSGEDAVSEASGHVYVPGTPEDLVYDDDGNLTSDGRWTYTWDAENRLIAMESHTGAPSASKRKHEFEYDYRWRRTLKKIYEWGGSTYSLSEERVFLYDGWNLLTELSGQEPQGFYVWGNDLSGSLQKAGGVAGLTLVVDGNGDEYVPQYDGNGNVMGMVSSSAGVQSSGYEYGPFGEALCADGAIAEVTRFRCSTKYQDDETGFLYYGYRHYAPATGRWLSRDPIGERGGVNLYASVRNSPFAYYDYLGLAEKRSCTYTIVGGHGLRGDGSVEDYLDQIKGGCGDRVGAVSCFSKRINQSYENGLPGSGDTEGILPGDPKDMADALEEKIKTAETNAESECGKKETCCSNVEIRVSCRPGGEPDFRRMAYTPGHLVDAKYQKDLGRLRAACNYSNKLQCPTKKWERKTYK